MVFMYVVVLPSPTIIYLHKEQKAKRVDSSLQTLEEETQNPLTLRAEDDTDNASVTTTMPRSRLARMQRNAKAVETSLRKDNGTLHQQVEKLKKEVSMLKFQLGQTSDSGVDLVAPAPPQLDKLDSLKKLVDDASLTEETRAAAQASLQDHLAAQFEVSARERQQSRRDAYLSDLVTEQRFVSSVQSTLLGNDHSAAAAQARAKLQTWLGTHRLYRHFQSITDVVGRDTAPEDLKLLTEEDVAELSGNMTQVEKLRFIAALQSLPGPGPELELEPEPEPESE